MNIKIHTQSVAEGIELETMNCYFYCIDGSVEQIELVSTIKRCTDTEWNHFHISWLAQKKNMITAVLMELIISVPGSELHFVVVYSLAILS